NPIEELASSIRQIMDGKRIYAPELVDILLDRDATRTNPLTERELEVLKLVADGLSTKDIAEKLFLSHGTVRNYISIIIEKLQVSNRIEAISRVREMGWFQ